MRVNKQTKMVIGGVLVLALALNEVPASAQGTPQQRSACMGDAFRLCSADIPDAARIEACLLQNRERLQPGCQAQFDDAGGRRLQPEQLR